MIMEHITITEIGDGLMRLVPEEGYLLYNVITRRAYSEAEVTDSRPYIAIRAEEHRAEP